KRASNCPSVIVPTSDGGELLRMWRITWLIWPVAMWVAPVACCPPVCSSKWPGAPNFFPAKRVSSFGPGLGGRPVRYRGLHPGRSARRSEKQGEEDCAVGCGVMSDSNDVRRHQSRKLSFPGSAWNALLRRNPVGVARDAAVSSRYPPRRQDLP